MKLLLMALAMLIMVPFVLVATGIRFVLWHTIGIESDTPPWVEVFCRLNDAVLKRVEK